jgi:transposase-like protein
MSKTTELLGDRYELSTDGVLTNKLTNRTLRGTVGGTGGYLGFSIKDSNRVRVKVNLHRMLAELYIPNPNNLPEVNHKDGVKLNNSLDNLEWISTVGNIRHAFSNGLTSNGASVDYVMVPALLNELISGVTLHELAQRNGVKESGTLRKLLRREAVRTGRLTEFMHGTKKARANVVTAQSHKVVASLNGVAVAQFESINAAARHHGVSPATVWKAIHHNRVFRELTWSRY